MDKPVKPILGSERSRRLAHMLLNSGSLRREVMRQHARSDKKRVYKASTLLVELILTAFERAEVPSHHHPSVEAWKELARDIGSVCAALGL